MERRSKGACGWRLFCRRQKKTPEQSGRPPGLEGTGELPRPPIGEECCPQGGLPTASQQSGSQLERRSKGACGWPPGLEGTGNPRDLRLEKNAARRAACQLRASKAGRSWKGGARERADGVFFAAGRKKTPEQSGLCSDVVPKVGLEPTRYRYQRILSPSRLPFHHFGISTKLSIP